MDEIDKFLDYEFKNELFKIEIYGVKFWHFVRFKVYQKILKEINGTREVNVSIKRSGLEKVMIRLDQIYNIIFKSPLFGLKSKDILVLNSSRRIKNDKFYECIYTDDLIKDPNASYYVLENPYLGEHFKPTKTKNLLYTDAISFKRTLERRRLLKEKRFSLKAEDIVLLKKILDDLNNIYGLDIQIDFLISGVEEVIYNYKTSINYYRSILEKINPKIILEVCNYEFDKMLINEVAKEKGIKVVELQHGTIDRYHAAYNFHGGMNLPNFPDYIFTFGEYWSNTSRFPIESGNVIDIGFYNFEKKKNMFDNTKKAKNILFLSQNTIGQELSKLAVKLKEKLKDEYNIIYKLHPKEFSVWKEEYPHLIKSGIEVIDHNQKDLYYYFAISSMQVGVYSTAVFEGIGFNVKTCILNTFGHEYMRALYENGYARLINNEDEIIDELNGGKLNSEDIKEKLWKSNSLDNFRKAMKILLPNEKE